MASTADSTGAALTTSAADIYTVPAGKVAHILGITAANIDGTNAVDVTAQWTNASAADAITRLAYQVTVAAKDSRSLLAGPLALAAGDKIQGLATAADYAEITITYYTEDEA